MPAPALLAAAVAAGTLTVRSDTPAIRAYVQRPRGTVYWGGAGLNGAYVPPTLNALQQAGIRHVHVGLTNTAARDWGDWFGTKLDALRAGMVIRYEDDGDWTLTSGMAENAPQFNLIGYSYGSLLAAQTAHFYARRGHWIDHLVLIASPIDGSFLKRLRSHPFIRRTVVLDLTAHGDPVYAGMSQAELLRPETIAKLSREDSARRGEGHFHYAHPIPDLPRRLRELAARLRDEGLR